MSAVAIRVRVRSRHSPLVEYRADALAPTTWTEDQCSVALGRRRRRRPMSNHRTKIPLRVQQFSRQSDHGVTHSHHARGSVAAVPMWPPLPPAWWAGALAMLSMICKAQL